MTTPLELATTKEPTRAGKLPLMLGVAAGTLAVAAAVLFVVFKTDLLASIAAPEAAPAPIVVAAPPPAREPEPEPAPKVEEKPEIEEAQKPAPKGSIFVNAKVDPLYAVVSIDGKKVGRGTFRLERRADDKEHTILIEAPGYRDHRENVRFTETVDLSVTLERETSRRKSGDRASRSDEPEPAGPSAVVVPEEQKPAKTIVITKEADPPAPKPVPKSKKDRIIDESAPWD